MQLTEKQKSDGWRIVKFGDIAEQVSKRINPTPDDSLRYIGLEHLDSGNLRVSRWGTDIVLKGQKLEMKKGDILFAKRNAYLKRVAIAPFNGIFSAHGMILRPRGELVIPEFLPFFMQSDLFMDRAVAISEGSLSPTIKWKTLAKQEFPLPPRPRQEEMLEVFEKIENSIQKNTETYDSAIKAKRVSVTQTINYLSEKNGTLQIDEYCEKVTDGTHDTPQPSPTGFLLLTSKNLEDGKINFGGAYTISEQDLIKVEKRSKVDVGDVLFAMIGKLGSPVVVKEEHGRFGIKNVALFKCSQDMLKANLLKEYLDSPLFEKEILANQTGNAQKFLPLKMLRKILVPVADEEELETFGKVTNHFNSIIDNLSNKRQSILSIRNKILLNYLEESA